MFLTLALVLLGAPLDVPKPVLPAPNATPSVNKQPKVIGWPKGKLPTAPAGFTVSLYAAKSQCMIVSSPNQSLAKIHCTASITT